MTRSRVPVVRTSTKPPVVPPGGPTAPEWMATKSDISILQQGVTRKNLRSAGLALDGSDDLAAWQAMIDADPGGTEYVVPDNAIVTLSGPLSIAGKPHMRIKGYQGSTIQWSAASTQPLLLVTGSDHFGMDGLTITGGETAFVGTDSNQYAVRLVDSPDADLGDLTISGTSRGVDLLRCDRAIVDHLDYTGFATSEITGVNWHNGLSVSDSDGTQLTRLNAQNCGSVLTVLGDSQRGVVALLRGRNIHDNGIYISSGAGWKLVMPVIRNDVLSGTNVGMKLRGSDHLCVAGHVENMGTGYSLVDYGDSGDGYGGSGSQLVASTARGCGGAGIDIRMQGTLPPRGFMVDACAVEGCGALGGGTASVMVQNGDYHKLSNISIYNHLGTGSAVMVIGTSGRPLVGIEMDRITVRKVGGGLTTYGMQANYTDRLVVDRMTLQDIIAGRYGIQLANSTNAQVTRTRAIGTVGTIAVLRVNDATSTANMLIDNPGCTISDLGTGTIKPQTYTVTNGLTDRTFDADTVTVAELADVVGTLIADLRARGGVA